MAATPEPRIPPLPAGEWPAEMKAALGAMRVDDPRHPPAPRRPDQPKGLNVLGTFAQHPALAKAFLTFNAHVLSNTTLSERQRELVVLRVAALRGAAYEWAQHVRIGADVGITPDEVDRIDAGPDAGWEGIERALLQATDELVRDACISDATWAALTPGLDTQQVLDLVFTVGAYDLLAMALKTCGTPLDDDLL